MSRRGHIRIFLIATAVWAGFWILGLPAYYRQYSTSTMIWFDALVLVPITAACFLVLRRRRPERRMPMAGWLAFYFTVPLAVYDWLYCGFFLGYGMRFFTIYWYLTVYYAIPWIVLPLIAYLLNRGVQADRRRGA